MLMFANKLGRARVYDVLRSLQQSRRSSVNIECLPFQMFVVVTFAFLAQAFGRILASVDVDAAGELQICFPSLL